MKKNKIVGIDVGYINNEKIGIIFWCKFMRKNGDKITVREYDDINKRYFSFLCHYLENNIGGVV